MRIIKS